MQHPAVRSGRPSRPCSCYTQVPSPAGGSDEDPRAGTPEPPSSVSSGLEAHFGLSPMLSHVKPSAVGRMPMGWPSTWVPKHLESWVAVRWSLDPGAAALTTPGVAIPSPGRDDAVGINGGLPSLTPRELPELPFNPAGVVGRLVGGLLSSASRVAQQPSVSIDPK